MSTDDGLILDLVFEFSEKNEPPALLRRIVRPGGGGLRWKFSLTLFISAVWLTLSGWLAIGWAGELSGKMPLWYVWWVIIGIALLPGFLMSGMFFSNLMNRRQTRAPNTAQPVTVLVCARNEEDNIGRCIRALLDQCYDGPITVLAVDNASSDDTRAEILQMKLQSSARRQVEYLFCGRPGKANALNCGLAQVETPFFITVDADTFLERNAVQRIMNHIAGCGSACVAGNLFVQNPYASLAAAMQTYDYLLSIAAIKRYQGSYRSTLVAQGAFSAFRTAAVRAVGGWQDVMGEDIVLTYSLLQQGWPSTYEPRAVGYTRVPETLNGLYNQRKRWGIGMLEGLATVPPWKQGSGYAAFFTSINFLVIDLDLAFLFGFLPGVLLAVLGYPYFVGCLTLFTLAICILMYLSMYLYQRGLGIPFRNSLPGFVAFLLFFQLIQSTAALNGYLVHLFHRKERWK